MRWRSRGLIALWLSLLLSVSPAAAHADLNAAVNAYRAAPGLPTLATSALLETVAHQRAVEVSVNFSHVDLSQRVGCSWGEIIASNSGTSDPVSHAVWTQWANSPAHDAVMRGGWTDIGSGTYVSGSRTYLVVLFLNPCGPQGPPIVDVIPDTAMGGPD